MSVGQNIAEIRKLRDITQQELAEKVGVSQSYVARWETGRSQPRPKALEKIADALSVSVEELLVGGKPQLESALNLKDEELVELLRELQHLSDDELQALKTVMRGLLARSRLEQMLTR